MKELRRASALASRASLVASAAAAALVLVSPSCRAADGGYNPPEPPAQDIAPVPPPANAKDVVVLFSGKEDEITNNWGGYRQPWAVKEGAMIAGGHGNIVSKEKFGNFQLHLEFKEPYMPNAFGQGRGNSGVFLQSRYEVQVLDSYATKQPGKGDCGAIYNQAAPLVHAYKPPRWWQTYDIFFRAARLDDQGNIKENARVTVLLNGQVIQNNTEITPTPGGLDQDPKKGPGPLMLQDHGCPVEFRNIWVIPLPDKGADYYQEPTAGAGH